jgi:hypothetical protein
MPTGLDIWNQKILKAPGHYARAPGFKMPPGPPPAPEVFWPDQQPERLDAPLQQQLDHWLTLVHRGQVLEAYRVFLGIMETPEHRKAALAQLVFAGLIDVQDRSVFNRSYTTGHKSFRARATVEVGTALGWDNAHHVLYAGALDIAVGPRWYSTYEMACNVITIFIEGQTVSAIPYAGTTERERALLANTAPLSAEEGEALLTEVFEQAEPDYLKALTGLLAAGKSPRRILDALQLGAAKVVLATRHPNGFSLPQHCYEYLNTLGWFWDNFEHPHKIKLLVLAASYLKQAAWHQRHTGDWHDDAPAAPAGADKLSAAQLLERVDAAVLGLNGPESVAWTKAYLDSGADRGALVQRLALLASRLGNDPHNQEIAQNLLEDSRRNQGWDADRLLLACAHHTAAHRKYGDPLDCSRRFGSALDLPALQ